MDVTEYLSEVDLKEQQFHSAVREVVILAIASLVLYIGSFILVEYLRRERDEEFEPYTDTSDLWVYKISLWCCSFSLAVSVGAALLLPISTISNEILLHYPKSWYMKWLNSSLIQGIWNLMFTLTNLALFVFLPFAYLLCESEGFIGARRGLLARAKETFVTLFLLCCLILGITIVLSAILDREQSTITQLYNIYQYYLPFLYSCVSIIGVLLLLVCTPLGFVRLFSLVGDRVTKPQFMRDLDEEFAVAKLEEQSINKRLTNYRAATRLVNMAPIVAGDGSLLQNGELEEYLERNLKEAKNKVDFYVTARSRSRWNRTFIWPLVFLVLLFLTGLCMYLVFINLMLLMSGWRELPTHTANFDLGQTSLSTLGFLGVTFEVFIIGYLLITSIVGLYSIPYFRKVLPAPRDTPISNLIINCGLYVVLSSALPLLVKVLGITNFDLLGNYGKIKWLRSFFIIFLVNLIFGLGAAVCIFNRVTQKAQAETIKRIKLFYKSVNWNFLRNVYGPSLPNVAASPVRMKAE
eukprot:TRINITY_DN5359_c0_g2_i1.p1 TRINITY_DN5359_c0_g2~~TRINITY_DN5359_c0_g2_i1.p1  ORF type:complete len:522 (+),score=113.51 TRINITY_DN5359_c0_g2_i1:309-1874(+)